MTQHLLESSRQAYNLLLFKYNIWTVPRASSPAINAPRKQGRSTTMKNYTTALTDRNATDDMLQRYSTVPSERFLAIVEALSDSRVRTLHHRSLPAKIQVRCVFPPFS